MKVKYLYVSEGNAINIDNYPNFSVSGSIKDMRKTYGKNALLVRCGSYIYNVSENPDIYSMAH